MGQIFELQKVLAMENVIRIVPLLLLFTTNSYASLISPNDTVCGRSLNARKSSTGLVKGADAITFFCDNAPPTLLRLNIARERAYSDDIRALTISCPHLQYLNIAETSVAYQDIITIVLAWKKTMINLCLPHRLGFVLTLRSRAPNLPLISQFETLINQMECLESLPVGHYKFHQADIDNRSPQVSRLKRMFPNLQINHNPSG